MYPTSVFPCVLCVKAFDLVRPEIHKLQIDPKIMPAQHGDHPAVDVILNEAVFQAE
jgi:hypothetical protein